MPGTNIRHPEEGPEGPSRRTHGAIAAPFVTPLRRVMDALYWACAAIAGSALVVISLIVPWGVYTRYVLDSAASWPEPMAILLSIVLTFFGAAACYRSGTHMRVTFMTRAMLFQRGDAKVARCVDEIAEIVFGLR